MLFHENRMSDYFNLAISIQNTMSTIKPLSFNSNIICAREGLSNLISTSLEGLDSEDRIKVFSKSSEKYVNVLLETIKKHIDSFKKQIALIKETYGPLYKVNMIFEQLYGNEQLQKIISTTPVLYFPNAQVEFNGGKDGSLQMFLIETLCSDVYKSIEDIRKDLINHFDCSVSADNQISYPDFTAITRPKIKPMSLTELGYPVEYVSYGFNKLLNTGEHVKLSTSLDRFISTIESIKRDSLNCIYKVKEIKDDLPSQVKNIGTEIVSLQTYAVLFGTLVVLLQAVAYSAYEAAYKIHLAEIEFNKTQTR